MQSKTVFLGKLLGLYLIAVSLAMFAHPQTTVEIMKGIIHDPPVLFISGLIGIAAGLAIVLNHNVWSGGVLRVSVTLFGWISLIKGVLLLMLPPETESRVFIDGLRYEQFPNVYAAVALVFGAGLTFMSFGSTTLSAKPE